MKKTFLSLFLWLCALLGYAQPAGVTVITHGFDALGTGNIPDWLNHGYEVAARYNQTHPTGPRATVLTNTDSGMWVIDSRDGNGTGNANAELIFVFNWSAYSNNLGHQRWLEAAADHLFALLVQPQYIIR